jgi:hypothetical protein
VNFISNNIILIRKKRETVTDWKRLNSNEINGIWEPGQKSETGKEKLKQLFA